MHRSIRSLICILLLLVLTLSLVPIDAQAQGKTASWKRWDVDISIHTDGSFDVVETHEIGFSGGEFTFGFRNIPLDQAEQINNIQVREGDTIYTESTSEEPNTFYTEADRGELIVNWFFPPTIDAARTFTVSYTVEGGVLIYDGGDQLYWKAVGSERGITVQDSTVTVRLPEGAAVDLAKTYGTSARPPAIAEDGGTVTFKINGSIASNDEFEVRVQWPHGYVDAPVPSWQAGWERRRMISDVAQDPNQVNLLVGLLSFGLVIGGILVTRSLTRYPRPNYRHDPVPTTLNEPPGDLPPGMVGVLVDGKTAMPVIIATMIDLARRGLIEIEETVKGSFLFRQLPSEGQKLRHYEQAVLDAIFAREPEVPLPALQYRFYKTTNTLYEQLGQEMVNAGMLRSNPNSQGCGVPILFAIIFLIASIVSFPLFYSLDIAHTDLTPMMPFGAGLILMIASTVVAFGIKPHLTRKGAEQRAKWLAFKKYLEQIQQFTDLKEATDLFDKYLPYAIAFDIKRSWIEKFASVPQTAQPKWYITPSRQQLDGSAPVTGLGSAGSSGASGASAAPSLDGIANSMFTGLDGISDGLFNMLNMTASTFSSSTPGSSSSSSSSGFSSSGGGGGFSGGGSSGGGGGGGGGGGFG